MPHTIEETAAAVTLVPSTPPNAAIIWLHGLGADGHDFVPIAGELQLPPSLSVRFVFPHAQPRPVTINNGYVMRAWYDITGLSRGNPEDAAGIRESGNVVRRHIESEMARGIAADRIVIAGFSQGGAVALHTALRYPQRLAGVMGLSTYLPLRDSLATEASVANRDLPILMCHGSRDGVVPTALGSSSCDLLRELGYPVEWHSYPMEHQVCMEEIADISAWLAKVIVSRES
jgi:phospholipase/carboxylesterase